MLIKWYLKRIAACNILPWFLKTSWFVSATNWKRDLRHRSLSKISKMNFCKVWPWSPLCMRCACACVPYVLGELTKAKCTIPNNPRHIVSSYVANFVVNHKTFFHWNGAYKFHSSELESQLHCWSGRKETRIFKSFQFTSMPGKWKFDLFFKWFSCILILISFINFVHLFTQTYI